MPIKKLIGPGRLPKLENIKNLTNEQLRKVLHRFGINATEIRNQMLREISRPAGRISGLMRQKLEPDQTMLNQLHGQIKRIRTSLERRMTAKAIAEFQAERNKILYEDQTKRIWVWITTFKNSCESCIPRHHVVKSMKEWENQGLPKSDALICDGNCNCNLMPYPELEGQKIESNPRNLNEFRRQQWGKKEVKILKELSKV